MAKTTLSQAGGLRVLIAGGGVAGVEAMLALRALAPRLVDVELVAPEHHFWYRPLAVAEPFAAGRVHMFELAGIAATAGCRFTPGELAAIDPAARVASTTSGMELPYDVLVVTSGARPKPALAGAFTFRGPADSTAFRKLLDELEAETIKRIVFAVPGGVVWPLPLYELALMTAAHTRTLGLNGVGIALVTHESAPLGIFGETASDAAARLLDEGGIHFFPARYPVAFADGALTLVPGGSIPADRVVALPRLTGTAIPGIPHDADGFIPTDEYGRVRDVDDVYAAGDATTFPVKQGGIAAQQADAVAEAIAERAGAAIEPRPFCPVLRGLLLTGDVPAYLRAELSGGRGETSVAAPETLWWPPGKIVGRYLAPFLATHGGVETVSPAGAGVLEVEADLSALGRPGERHHDPVGVGPRTEIAQ
jgi:sulfide:quinone oxidoreductase